MWQLEDQKVLGLRFQVGSWRIWRHSYKKSKEKKELYRVNIKLLNKIH